MPTSAFTSDHIWLSAGVAVSFWFITLDLPKHTVTERQRSLDMICIRAATVSTFLLLVCILAKPVQSWEYTDNRRTRSLRGFSDSAEVSVTNSRWPAAHLLALRTILPPLALCPVAYCGLQILAKPAGRKLTQSGSLAEGVYNIQTEGRLGSCSSYLSIPQCSEGDTVDLYSQDDGSGRQQWQLVSAGGTTLYALLFHQLLLLQQGPFILSTRRLWVLTAVHCAHMSTLLLHTQGSLCCRRQPLLPGAKQRQIRLHKLAFRPALP